MGWLPSLDSLMHATWVDAAWLDTQIAAKLAEIKRRMKTWKCSEIDAQKKDDGAGLWPWLALEGAYTRAVQIDDCTVQIQFGAEGAWSVENATIDFAYWTSKAKVRKAESQQVEDEGESVIREDQRSYVTEVAMCHAPPPHYEDAVLGPSELRAERSRFDKRLRRHEVNLEPAKKEVIRQLERQLTSRYAKHGSALNLSIRYLTHSWQDDFFVLHSQRKALHSLRSPSRVDTTAVLRKFSDSKHKALIREISGAYQIAAQKTKWIPEATLSCQFCSSTDSRIHRLVECPAFQETRDPYQHLLKELCDLDHHLLWFPMILRHPDTDAHFCIHEREPVACVCDEAKAHAARMCNLGFPPVFYTDGSCAYPSHPSSRFTGYAIIMDLATDIAQRIAAADQFLLDGRFPLSLQLVAAGKTIGEQNVGRAEISALIAVAEAIPSCVIYSDSAFALGIMKSLQRGCVSSDFAQKDNLDLISRAACCNLSEIAFEKIAAHRDISSIRCPLERYNAIGNAFADKCAVEACHNLNPEWVRSLAAKQMDLQKDREALQQLCSLHIEIAQSQTRC